MSLLHACLPALLSLLPILHFSFLSICFSVFSSFTAFFVYHCATFYISISTQCQASSRRHRSVHARMIHLPGNIILKILADECISKPDLKNLRLASKFTTKFATDLLFSRIYISKLKSDRESFFNIAAQPHLAAAVQTVTWLEMAEDETSLTHVDKGLGDQDVVESNFFARLRPLARALFWLPFPERNVQNDGS